MESEEEFTWRNFWVEEEVGRQEFEGRPGGKEGTTFFRH
jgi:hypothetical protein